MAATLAQLKKLKAISPILGMMDQRRRNAVLVTLSKELVKETDRILLENARDLAAMPKDDPRYDRLLLNRDRVKGMARDVRKVASLPCAVGGVIEQRTMPNGLKISKVAVPLGVAGVIYESRPNVTIDVFALCFKAGNGVALKGGKEARHSNAVLADIIRRVLKSHDIDPHVLCLLPPDRAETQVLLNASGLVDVCIPRGSQALIDHVRSNAKVPVIETGAGIVHAYFDKSGDLAKGKAIVNNSKTRRVSVCNALDTLLIHKDRLPDLPALVELLAKSNVEIFADAQAHAALKPSYPATLLQKAKAEDFGREFLSYKMSVKTVPTFDAALDHIAAHTSHHSEAIIAEDKAVIERFLSAVDAAAVYANAPTSFTDGGEFGLGAEIGISTQKLHARGPMGLDALTSYKWVVRGSGQVRA
jgi:glutamate-5-semialdehyde dehydrogenase